MANFSSRGCEQPPRQAPVHHGGESASMPPAFAPHHIPTSAQDAIKCYFDPAGNEFSIVNSDQGQPRGAGIFSRLRERLRNRQDRDDDSQPDVGPNNNDQNNFTAPNDTSKPGPIKLSEQNHLIPSSGKVDLSNTNSDVPDAYDTLKQKYKAPPVAAPREGNDKTNDSQTTRDNTPPSDKNRPREYNDTQVADFLKAAQESKLPVVIRVGDLQNCGPCQQMEGQWTGTNGALNELQGKALVLHLDAAGKGPGWLRDMQQQLNLPPIRGYPTTLVGKIGDNGLPHFDQGGTRVGYMNSSTIKQFVEQQSR